MDTRQYPIKPILVPPDLTHAWQLKKFGVDIEKLIARYSENPEVSFSITLSSDKKRIVSFRTLGLCKSQIEYDVLSSEFIDKVKNLFEIESPREYVERSKAEWEEQKIRAEFAAHRLTAKFGPKPKPPKRGFWDWVFNGGKR